MPPFSERRRRTEIHPSSSEKPGTPRGGKFIRKDSLRQRYPKRDTIGPQVLSVTLDLDCDRRPRRLDSGWRSGVSSLPNYVGRRTGREGIRHVWDREFSFYQRKKFVLIRFWYFRFFAKGDSWEVSPKMYEEPNRNF